MGFITNFCKAVRSLIRMMWLALMRSLTVPSSDRFDGVDVCLVSPGGVGTTFLIDHLSKFVRTNDVSDRDGLKHLPRPPQAVSSSVKFLFITGDANAVYSSIKRRGWLQIQGAKLASLGAVLLRGNAQRTAFIRAVIAQEKAWRKSKSLAVEFVEYEEIWDVKHRLKDYLQISDSEFIDSFPQRIARQSASGFTS